MPARDILFGGAGGGSRAADLGLLVLRLFAGLALAFGHGVNKLPPSPRFLEGVVEMGFPAPLFFGWAAGISEFGGGVLVALGLLTRPGALLASVVLFVASFIRQAGDPFGERELSLLFLSVMVMLMLTGAGRFSLDALLRRRR